jgi:PhzF family phenazine biosynthesis protein
MGRGVRVFQVDTFTTQRFCGNPAAVVLDAAALSEAELRALADEIGRRDIACVLDPSGPDHDLRLRFFTPRGEADFIGHATLAAHAVLAALGLAPRPRQRHRSGAVEVVRLRSDPPRLELRLPAPRLGRALEAQETSAVLAALGLAPGELEARCPAMLAGDHGTRVLLGLRSADALRGLRPDLPRLSRLSEALGAAGFFPFAVCAATPVLRTEARMFCPAIGIDEDLVSANAHALLGALLLRQGLLPPAPADGSSARLEFLGAQGHHLGRPGEIAVAVWLEQGALQSVSITGDAVLAFATAIEFP